MEARGFPRRLKILQHWPTFSCSRTQVSHGYTSEDSAREPPASVAFRDEGSPLGSGWDGAARDRWPALAEELARAAGSRLGSGSFTRPRE